jgi:hypothetical protein
MDLGLYIADITVKTLVATLVPLVIKWLFDHSSKTKLRKKERELSDLRSFLFEYEKRHPSIVEEEMTKYLKVRYRYSEIITIMKIRNPMYTFGLITSAKGYIEFSDSEMHFLLKESIANEKKKKRKIFSNNILYFFFAIVGVFPAMYSPELIGSHGLSAIVVILFWSVFLVMIAIAMLIENTKIESAIKAIEQLSYSKT